MPTLSFCPGCICDLMRRLRSEKRSWNNTWKDGETFYGRPLLRVIDAAWNAQVDVAWDRSPEHLDEMIEVAESLGDGAFVTLSQEVFLMDGGEGTYLDEGYEIQVYPSLLVREGDTYLPVPADFTSDTHQADYH